MRASQSSVDQQVRKAADEPSKRIFDVCCAALGLVVLSPVFAVTAVLVKLDSRGPVFYRGLRMGRYGKLFRILKFRTMVANADKIGGPSTPDDDPRLTRAGRILRRYKLDEIPQLINVLKGEMSIVGPRPEVEEEVRTYTTEERLLLTVRPGMTDYASIRFHNEGQIIRGSPDPHQAYREKIRPEKIRLGLAYVRSHSMWVDLRIIWLTLKTLILTRLPPDSDEAVSA